MAARALRWALTLLLSGGLCSGQELELPSRLYGQTQGKVEFKPTRLPAGPFEGFTWIFQNVPIVNVIGDRNLTTAAYKDRISLNLNSLELELRDLTEMDTGEYTLTVTKNPFTFTKTTELEVFERVSNVAIRPSVTELTEFNGTVILVCSASGSSLSFSWLNGSSEMTEGERVHLTDRNSTLTIVNMSRHEGGPYTCKAFNIISLDMSEPLTLTINYGPDNALVKASPSEPIYSSGSDLTLTCSAESSPAAEYQWVVDGSVLSEVGKELKLTNIQSNNSGSYTCIAHNTKTLRSSTSELLNITVLEKISAVELIGPSDFIIEGNSTQLACEGNGMVVRAEWTKDDQRLSPSSSVTFSSDNKSVTINPVRSEDGGEYKCTLRNPVSSDSAVYIMTVNYGPDSVQVNGLREVEEAKNETLQCISKSVPEPFYEWEFNGTKSTVTTSTFSIHLATFKDSGNYTCIAWNNITRRYASGSHILAVKEKTIWNDLGGPLSDGAIAGIVIGAVLGIGGVIGLIVFLKKKPKLNSRGNKQNGVSQNGGEHELNYADVQHVQNSVVNMGGPNTQTRQGTPGIVRANRGTAQNQGGRPTPKTEVIYSEVKK